MSCGGSKQINVGAAILLPVFTLELTFNNIFISVSKSKQYVLMARRLCVKNSTAFYY